MIRNIKALGLAFLALAAVGALSASAAQAQTPGQVHITTEKETAVVTGHGENEVLTIGVTTIQCKKATLEGTVKGVAGPQLTAQEIEVTPSYSECQGFGGIPVQVIMHGCKYTIKGTLELTAEGGVTGCTGTKQITIISQACTVFIGNQTKDFSHITFTNNTETKTEKHHIQDHVTVSGFSYTTNGQFLCPQGTASYKGTTTIKAFEDLGTKLDKDPVSGHEFLTHLCGAEVGILGT